MPKRSAKSSVRVSVCITVCGRFHFTSLTRSRAWSGAASVIVPNSFVYTLLLELVLGQTTGRTFPFASLLIALPDAGMLTTFMRSHRKERRRRVLLATGCRQLLASFCSPITRAC
ncbi:hypothetical protein DL93DRAFT_1810053 [Clavulina sp. PMI_390]|nr:hypothetical protein DL93DRAFT_1810053 [Clavulina sp. PMI_390]